MEVDSVIHSVIENINGELTTHPSGMESIHTSLLSLLLESGPLTITVQFISLVNLYPKATNAVPLLVDPNPSSPLPST